MSSRADSLSNGHESDGEPRRNEDNASPTDNPQIGDIGASASQQLAASQAASPTITEVEVEREMNTLERDIKQEKKLNPKGRSAITFDQSEMIWHIIQYYEQAKEQLRHQIYHIIKFYEEAKEQFCERICEAADIERASLKNRLNKDKIKFGPSPFSGSNSQAPPISFQPSSLADRSLADRSLADRSLADRSLADRSLADRSLAENSPTASQAASPNITKPPNFMRAPMGGMENRSISPGSTADEDNVRIPVERVNELFQLGFTYDEVKEFNSLFDQFKQLSKDVCPSTQLLTAFSNFISQSVPDPLKLICTTFNLLEMGYTRREMLKIVNQERRSGSEDVSISVLNLGLD